MDLNNLQLIVELRFKADRLDEVEERALAFVQRTREQPGCEEVSFFRVNEDSERFVFLAGVLQQGDQAALGLQLERRFLDRFAFRLAPARFPYLCHRRDAFGLLLGEILRLGAILRQIVKRPGSVAFANDFVIANSDSTLEFQRRTNRVPAGRSATIYPVG